MIRVHITDDHKTFVESLTASINESNIAGVTGFSYSLEECRKVLSPKTTDVLLLDISLPDGNGVDFCKEIHQKYPDIKILVRNYLNSLWMDIAIRKCRKNFF